MWQLTNGLFVDGHVNVSGALAAGEADYVHFTWWSQATFTAYSVLGILGIEAEVWFFASSRC